MINIRRILSTAAVAAAVGSIATVGASTAAAATHPAATVNDVAVTAKPIKYSEGAGNSYLRIFIKNTSRHSVSIKGYAGLSIVAYGNGTQVGEPAVWEGQKPRTVDLRPGERTREVVRVSNADNYGSRKHTVDADGFRVYLPGETRAVFVPYELRATTKHVHQLSETPIGYGVPR